MIEYIGILPHSPSLLNKKKSEKIDDAFKKIANDIQAKNISNIISIAAHPLFERSTFSLYVHPQYNLQFKEFGNLVSSLQLDTWWEAYLYFREHSDEIRIDLIDEPDIDHAHSIPLFRLFQHLDSKKLPRILPINNASSKETDEIVNLVTHIKSVQHNLPYAILFNLGMYSTSNPSFINQVHEQNSKIRSYFKSKQSDDFKYQDSPQIQTSCIDKLAPIIATLVGNDYNYQEIFFQDNSNSSILFGKYTPIASI